MSFVSSHNIRNITFQKLTSARWLLTAKLFQWILVLSQKHVFNANPFQFPFSMSKISYAIAAQDPTSQPATHTSKESTRVLSAMAEPSPR